MLAHLSRVITFAKCAILVPLATAGKPVRLNDMYRAADAALYQAKEAGRNTVRLAT